MITFLKKRWVLFVVLILFVICKIPELHYAYYWDECWPYAVAIKNMYTHGISLMPNAIDAELSRGHPLFFHAAAACWMHIFGYSHISMHSFALLISLLFLVAIYEAGLSLFNQRVAVISLLLVATQVIYFVQSSFVLFDMLVAFLSFLTLYFYVKDRYFLTIICCSILFYTKESGLVAGFVAGMSALTGLFNRNTALRTRLYRLLSIAAPCILIGIFFLIQKHTRGWYIFPLHSDLIQHKWSIFWYSFRLNCVSGTLIRDLRCYDFLLLLGLSVLAAIKNKSLKYFILFLPGATIYYFADEFRARRMVTSISLFVLFIISIASLFYVLINLKVFRNDLQKKFILLTCAFIYCFWCFSSLNFFSMRYLLAAIVPMLFFTAVIFDVLISRTYTWLYYPAVLVILAISYFSFKEDDGWGDCDPGAFNGLDVQQHVVDYLEQQNSYDKSISGNFLENQHLVNPATGFLHSDKAFNNVHWTINGKTDYAIFVNIEPDTRYDEIKKDTTFHLAYRYQKGNIWTEIYGRK